MDISHVKKAGVLAALLWASFPTPARAVPPGFNIQGRLTDANGVNRDGSYSLKFTIYDAPTSGTPLWTRNYPALTVRNGNFQTVLGDAAGQPALSGIFSSGDSRHLEIQVLSGPGVPAAEPPLVPRQQLVSVPFALQSASAGGIVSPGPAVVTAGGAEAMRVLPNGNVGIGTAVPDARLHVYRADGNHAVQIIEMAGASNSSPFIQLKTDTRNWQITNHKAAGGLFKITDVTAGRERFVIDTSGNVGIGTSDPSTQLQLTNVMQIQGPAAPSYPTGGVGLELAYDADLNTTGTGIIQAYDRTGSSPRPLLLNHNGGNVGIGTTAPGQKLSVAGTVESTSGGFKFPDGTMQATASSISGHSVQVVRNELLTVFKTAKNIPVDDTIPQSNEGAELLTVTITPRAATNRLVVDFQGRCAADYASDPVIAIFRNSEANALVASTGYSSPYGLVFNLLANVEVVAGTTAPITFRARVGANSPTSRPDAVFNGDHDGNRRFGGVQRQVITVTEIAN